MKNSRSPVAAVRFPKPSATDGHADYMNAVFDASQKARTKQLEDAYNTAASDLAAAQAAANSYHKNAAEQAQKTAQATAAQFGRVAAPRDLNTGAGSQAAMMQTNRYQTGAAMRAKAQEQTNLNMDMQRGLLDSNYMAQRKKLIADNAYQRNSALYQDAVQADAARRQQAQFEKQMNIQNMQDTLAARKAAANVDLGEGADNGNTAYDPWEEYYGLWGLLKDSTPAKDSRLTPEQYTTLMTPDEFMENRVTMAGYGYQSYDDYLEAVARTRGVYKEEELSTEDYASLFL